METEKKKGLENPKLVETITFRTTAEKKLKLTQRAVDLGKPLSAHCEELICNLNDASEKESSEIQSNQIKKLYEMLEELLEKNSELQSQIKTLSSKPEPVTQLAIIPKEKTEEENKGVKEVSSNLSFIQMLVNAAPEKEKEKFEARIKKLIERRIKLGKAKGDEEAIYQCVVYCIQWGAFFDAG